MVEGLRRIWLHTSGNRILNPSQRRLRTNWGCILFYRLITRRCWKSSIAIACYLIWNLLVLYHLKPTSFKVTFRKDLFFLDPESQDMFTLWSLFWFSSTKIKLTLNWLNRNLCSSLLAQKYKQKNYILFVDEAIVHVCLTHWITHYMSTNCQPWTYP